MADASHPKTGASHKRVGSVVRGKYRVEAFLATGTMGNVYSATHRNGSRVALKILHAQLAEDPSLCERFRREGYFANSIGHPGIVRAIDDDLTEDGCPFLVMELLEGETLEGRRRRKGGKLPLSWVLPVAESLLEILAAAHAREVVHRDLKPDNVFITKTGDVKVLDFGVARWNDGKSSSDMTGVGMVLGTPAYMPPEQALGRREEVDAQSDLWAVGATLFVVLSGESVHAGGDAKAKLIATARTAARPLREAAPEMPRSVATVVDRALAFHKRERWPDAMSMREALRWARMSLEERPSQALAATSETALEPIPAPVPTRRGTDDEPTVMRIARPDEVPPQSKDFLTSAPPITLRDIPGARTTDIGGLAGPTLPSNEPVFSLRRVKEEAPSTERLPHAEDLRAVASDRMGAADIAHARAMPTYDPAEAMGDDMPASAPMQVAKSVDVNMSFTRPMAAMVIGAEFDSPRPAAGAPPPAFTPPDAIPALLTSAPFGSAPPQAYTEVYGSAPPMAGAPAGAPPYGYNSLAPPGGMAPPNGTMPAMAAAPSGSSLQDFPETPGPLLSQIVKPRNRLARIIIPLMLALIAVGAGALAMRARAASVRGAAAARLAAAKSSSAPMQPAASASAGPSGATPATSAIAVTSLPDSKPGDAKPASSSVAAASLTVDPPKKPRPKRKKPVVKPPVEPAADATTAATSEAAPPAEAPAPKEPDPTPTPPPLGGDNSGN